jgi:two-component SAPR family response regulator
VERGVNGDRLESLLSRAEKEEERILPPAERIRAPAKARPPLIIYAFGEARVLRGDRIISDSEWGTTKAKELFFYLLSRPPQRREQIGCAIWPELSPAKLRSSFHVTLYRVRRALDEPEIIVFEEGRYRFNRQISYWFDVEEFKELIATARELRGSDEEEAMECYREAISLYKGDFLEALYSDWILQEGRELQEKYIEALQELADFHVARREYERGIELYERILDKDNYREDAHRGIMKCYALLGQRGKALKHYHFLVEIMKRELGTSPLLETRELYERILEGEIGVSV